jgi:hypothetical protein
MSLEEIQGLLSQGKTPKELIQLGFPKSSVYRARKLLARKEDPVRKLLEMVQQWGAYKRDLCSYAKAKECQFFYAPLDPLMCVFCPEYDKKED